MIHLFVDDVRKCPAGFALARTAAECRLLLESEDIDILSLDYDLGWGEPSGLEAAKRLVASGRYPRRIYFHTSSPAGRKAMYELLKEAAPAGVEVHNGPVPDSLLAEIAARAAQSNS